MKWVRFRYLGIELLGAVRLEEDAVLVHSSHDVREARWSQNERREGEEYIVMRLMRR